MDIVRDDAAQRKKRKIIGLAIAGTLLLVAAAVWPRQTSPSARLSRSQAWIDTVHRGTLRIQVHAAGVLAPMDVQWIAAAVDGRVESVAILAGTKVEPDTVILEIQNPELQQAALDAQLQLRAAEGELKTRRSQVRSALLAQEATAADARADYEEGRQRAATDSELAKAGLISPVTLKFTQGREVQLASRADVEEKRLRLARDNMDADVAAAAARVEQARALVALKHQQRDALHVRAGRAGIIQEIAVEPGQRVTAGAVLARVAAPEPLKAVLQISEVQASSITNGQRTAIDTHNGVVAGRVARIDPAVRNGSVTIDVALPRALPAGVRPDLSVEGKIEIAEIADAIYVGRPVQASPKGTLSLFKLLPDGKTAVRTTVRVGRTSFDSVEILQGLAPGDRVILSDTTAFDRFDRITIED